MVGPAPARETGTDAADHGQPESDQPGNDGQVDNDDHGDADLPAENRIAACGCDASDRGAVPARWPAAFRSPGWQPLTPAELAACAPTVVMHVHLSDQTLFDNHGVVRTEAGPIIVEQLKRFLVQHDANIKIYPVIDPAETAPADSWEIPLRLRRAMAIRHPCSVFPHSPTTSRMDLDHTPAYHENGPPAADRDALPRTAGPL